MMSNEETPRNSPRKLSNMEKLERAKWFNIDDLDLSSSSDDQDHLDGPVEPMSMSSKSDQQFRSLRIKNILEQDEENKIISEAYPSLPIIQPTSLIDSADDQDHLDAPIERLPFPISSNFNQKFGSIRFKNSSEQVEAEPDETLFPAGSKAASIDSSISTTSDISEISTLADGFLFAEREFELIGKLDIEGFKGYTFNYGGGKSRIYINFEICSRSSPYYGRIIILELIIDSQKYPNVPIKSVKVLGKVYHPFIDNTGMVGLRDLSILSKRWETNGCICYICLSILRLLDDPRWEGGRVLNEEAHKLLMNDPEMFFQTAKSYN